jgi:hypothetical protein
VGVSDDEDIFWRSHPEVFGKLLAGVSNGAQEGLQLIDRELRSWSAVRTPGLDRVQPNLVNEFGGLGLC